MVFSKKAKCGGCSALKKTKVGGQPAYACELAYILKYRVVSGQAVQPVPSEACYKPTNVKDMKKAKELTEKRRA